MDKRKKIFFILLVVLSIGIYYFHKEKCADNLLMNVEALASGEGGNNQNCFYSGSVDCFGIKADYSIGTR